MNDRPDEFPRAMASLLAQEGIDLDIVVVGNGCIPDQVPEGCRTVDLPESVGIPEGRNIGARNVKGEYLIFFDNDAHLPRTDVLARLAARLDQDPQLAYMQPRIADPHTGTTLRRWVPRLRAADPTRPGTVTVMAEDVVLVRRSAFEEVGGWPGALFPLPRRHRPRLAAVGSRLHRPLQPGYPRPPPRHRPRPPRHVLPPQRPQPRLGRPPQPPGRPNPDQPRHLDSTPCGAYAHSMPCKSPSPDSPKAYEAGHGERTPHDLAHRHPPHPRGQATHHVTPVPLSLRLQQATRSAMASEDLSR
ncbi:glycosyltransferase family 2 protein [Streptomyces sp. NPDC058685]|uniref:glycosyltransferase family 2 protein n=1 Tax=Streptomyces sp. NPDC058685 TaxID=3346598 RepID=UPI00365188E6